MTNHTPSSTKATIIIAAYNEASVIRETLQQLHRAHAPSSYQILVICNGCTDDTEKIIHDEFQNVLCHSLKKSSKALAIRHAESLNPGFPRLYLDADINLSAADADRFISKARDHELEALLIPSSKVTTTQCSTMVKAFYRAWYNTPHVQTFGYGAGAYLINQAGRDRFGLWPELVADDAFIRSQFRTEETHLIQSIKVGVKAPKTLWSLIKVKARSKFGNLELKAYSKHIRVNDENNETTRIANTKSSAIAPLQPGDKLIYLMINLIALSLAKWQFIRGKNRWFRDNSNR